jgi:hypothetical protein
LVEHFDGRFEIVHWNDEARRLAEASIEMPQQRREAEAA